MAAHQKPDRASIRDLAARVSTIDPQAPRIFRVHADPQGGPIDIGVLLGGGLESSAAFEIVDPTTGKFYIQPGISAPGGTDVPRP